MPSKIHTFCVLSDRLNVGQFPPLEKKKSDIQSQQLFSAKTFPIKVKLKKSSKLGCWKWKYIHRDGKKCFRTLVVHCRRDTYLTPIYLHWDFRKFWHSPVWNIQFDELIFFPSLKTNWLFLPVQTVFFSKFLS